MTDVQMTKNMSVGKSIWITLLLCVTGYVSGRFTNMNDIPSVRLYRNLTENYVKQIPVLNPKDTLQVHAFLRIFQLLKLDSSSETIAVAGELILHWTDAFLTWSLDDYPDVDTLSLPASQVSCVLQICALKSHILIDLGSRVSQSRIFFLDQALLASRCATHCALLAS